MKNDWVLESWGIYTGKGLVKKIAIFEPNFSPYKYPSILKPSRSSYLPAYEDGTDRAFRNVGI